MAHANTSSLARRVGDAFGRTDAVIALGQSATIEVHLRWWNTAS
jgi:hypothetical protein